GKRRSSVQDDIGYDGPMHKIRQKADPCSQGSSLSMNKCFVPTASSKMASKILEHLERMIPKSARKTEKSATKLTSNLALGSLDKVESSKFLLSSQNNQKSRGSTSY
ncbi:hypothetical protein Tco_0395976, partial [Tanacetum coccineum]